MPVFTYPVAIIPFVFLLKRNKGHLARFTAHFAPFYVKLSILKVADLCSAFRSTTESCAIMAIIKLYMNY